MKKRTVYTELAYMLGQILLAFGTALTTQGGLGISMVVAPAYILHLKLVTVLPWFSFGVAEYALQLMVLLGMMALLRQVKPVWLLSILSAMLYGLLLDGAMHVSAMLPVWHWGWKIGIYTVGVLFCTAGISLLFSSYLPPAAYELLVKVVAQRWHRPVAKCKTLYDCGSLVAALFLSLALFGKVRGIGVGTVVCALCYGVLIRGFSSLFSRWFSFQDRFSLREKFEQKGVSL